MRTTRVGATAVCTERLAGATCHRSNGGRASRASRRGVAWTRVATLAAPVHSRPADWGLLAEWAYTPAKWRSMGAQSRAERGERGLRIRVFVFKRADSLAGVDDRGVVFAAESHADLRETRAGELS